MKILNNINHAISTALQQQLNATVDTKNEQIHLDCPKCKNKATIYSDLVLYCTNCDTATPLIEVVAQYLELPDDPILKELASCNIYQSLEDSDEYVFFNPKTKQQHKRFDIKSVKDTFKSVMFNQLISRTKTLRFDYHPNKGHTFDGCYNLYTPPDWKHSHFYNGSEIASAECPNVYIGFFKHLVGNDKDSFTYLLDWLSVSLRGRNQQYLMLLATGGIGKGTLAEILEALHGKDNYVTINSKQFRSGFNSQLQNKTVYYFNELYIEKNEEYLIDKLKEYVDPTLSIEGKGKDTITVANHGNVYISSNRLRFPYENNERRYSLLATTEKRLEDYAKEQGTDINGLRDELLNKDNIQLLAKALYNRKIRSDMSKAYKNEDKLNEVLDENLSDWSRYFLNVICSREAGKIVLLADIQKELNDNNLTNDFTPGRNSFKKLAEQTDKKIFTFHQEKQTATYYVNVAQKEKDND